MNDILYYDGQCPLCTKEINLLKRIADSQLKCEDLHQLELSDDKRTQMLKVLHLKRADKVWLTGVDATVAAWSHTRWGWLFVPLNWPLFRHISKPAYAYWANKRYQKRYTCQRCVDGV